MQWQSQKLTFRLLSIGSRFLIKRAIKKMAEPFKKNFAVEMD
ncbi:hypothetical protein D1BOALGB6SA_4912 [Olavius sp. associated proteobacterium Delta 1]|nr:hypothetical protein D1BOALGB6SA_4912 [Olavius sp. associated proteobacterium Delta 1]